MERDQEEKIREAKIKEVRRNIKNENLAKKKKILTAEEVVDRIEKVQEDKKEKAKEKQVRPKRNLIKKNMRKKNKTRYETDSDTSGTYRSDVSSENEDIETFYRR